MHTSEPTGHPDERFDCLVLGAGPAGLQMGYFLEQQGRSYCLLEASDGVGSFFRTYPRSRNLISFNKVHSIYDDPELRLRWDWNSLLSNYEFPFTRYSKRLYPRAEQLLQYLADFAERYRIRIQFRTRIVRVARAEGGGFALTAEDGRSFRCRYLVVATGTGTPYIPPIPGIEHAEGYERASLDPDDYEGQRVLIIGKGNSGFEIADEILDAAALVHMASPRPLQLAWNTRHAGNLRAHYTRLLDAYQLKTLNGTLDCVINGIERRGDHYVVDLTYVHADGEAERLVYDRVIRATGFRFDASIFDEASCPLEMTRNGRLPAMTSAWESTSTPDLFFAGNLMQVRDFRKAASPFIDGFRYNIRALHHLLEERYHGRPLPRTTLPLDADAVARAVLERICRTSALWAQFGFLCDAIVIDAERGEARYHEELPVDYVHDSALGLSERYYTVTFEWGSWEGDVFAIDRHPRHETAHTNVFLHPILRCYSRGALLGTHHVLEDLFGMYDAARESGIVERRSGRDMKRYHLEEHDEPLRRYFRESLPVRQGRRSASGEGS